MSRYAKKAPVTYWRITDVNDEAMLASLIEVVDDKGTGVAQRYLSLPLATVSFWEHVPMHWISFAVVGGSAVQNLEYTDAPRHDRDQNDELSERVAMALFYRKWAS